MHYETKVTRIDADKGFVEANSQSFEYDILINTGHTDEIFGFKHGELGYSGRTIIPVVLPSKYAFDNPDYFWAHYSGKQPYTRAVDFKKVTNNESETCLLTLEMLSDETRLYPKQTARDLEMFDLYKNEFPSNYYALGRLGKFKYTGITDAIEQAMELSEELG